LIFPSALLYHGQSFIAFLTRFRKPLEMLAMFLDRRAFADPHRQRFV
jgi:hypothetical protein